MASNYPSNNSFEFIQSDPVSDKIIDAYAKHNKNIKMSMSKEHYIQLSSVNSFPNVNVSNNLEKIDDYNYEVYTLTEDENYDKIIFYIHGGSYIFPITKEHVTFCDELASRTNSKVYMPLYGLAPNSTYKEAYAFLTDVYMNLLKENKTIIIMGDSAGGGLALGFTQYLKESNIKQPDKQVLMSPWVDLTLSNPNIKYFDKLDIMLCSYGLIQQGKQWAGDLNRSDYKVSPINGNLSGLPETLLFASDSEVFFPDINILYDKMSVNTTVHYVVAANMIHVYPLSNTTAGLKSQVKIIKFINDDL